MWFFYGPGLPVPTFVHVTQAARCAQAETPGRCFNLKSSVHRSISAAPAGAQSVMASQGPTAHAVESAFTGKLSRFKFKLARVSAYYRDS